MNADNDTWSTNPSCSTNLSSITSGAFCSEWPFLEEVSALAKQTTEAELKPYDNRLIYFKLKSLFTPITYRNLHDLFIVSGYEPPEESFFYRDGLHTSLLFQSAENKELLQRLIASRTSFTPIVIRDIFGDTTLIREAPLFIDEELLEAQQKLDPSRVYNGCIVDLTLETPFTAITYEKLRHVLIASGYTPPDEEYFHTVPLDITGYICFRDPSCDDMLQQAESLASSEHTPFTSKVALSADDSLADSEIIGTPVPPELPTRTDEDSSSSVTSPDITDSEEILQLIEAVRNGPNLIVRPDGTITTTDLASRPIPRDSTNDTLISPSCFA